MFRKLFEIFRLKSLARQLRKPGGTLGKKVGTMMNRANKTLYDFTISVMQPGYYQSILEIGFGNGKFFHQVLDAAEGLTLTGIDYSKTMVQSAENNNAELVRSGRLKLLQGNSDQMPFPDESFDKVFCINVAYFWDEPLSHLREILRVLKPGGMLYVTVRSVESMERMPFTKYGFRKVNSETWKQQCSSAGFIWEKEEKLVEPASEFQPDPRPFESFCLVARKP